MIETTLVPLQDKAGDLCDKSNYRPVGLCSVLSKILEVIILKRIENCLYTTANHFFLLKEVVNFYRESNTSVFICFMDATKAFDRVNHSKLFTTLIDSKDPTYLVRLLYYWYSEQIVCVKWGKETSEYFKCTNGVRQGGILSPLLFNVYFDHVSSKLNDIHVGCLLGSSILNHLLYAYDLVLVYPSATGLQKLINCCVHNGHLLDIRFNEAKTKTMYVYSSLKTSVKFLSLIC